MKIKSVSCRQFAGLRNIKPVDFEDGLNIIYGPNESGKSTLVGLIYSLLWQSCKIGGRSASDKEYKSLYFPAAVRTGLRGNTIDGQLTVEGEDGSYTISKKWATSDASGASGDLNTPSALLDEVANNDAYVSAMKNLLKYGQGVYREAIFANQKTIDSILVALLGGNLTSDLSAVATSAMMDMGGISSEKFLAAIEGKLEELGNSWDFLRNGPKGGRGIDNKIQKNIGLILKAYYDLEESKKKLSGLQKITEDVGTADKVYKDAVEAYDKAKKNFEEFEKFYTLLLNYKKTTELKDAAKSELGRRRAAQENWPKYICDLEKAIKLQAELHRAEIIQQWKNVKAILANAEKVEDEIAALPQIDIADVNRAKELVNGIQRLENKLKNFSALITFTLSSGYELIVTSEVDGRRIEISDGKIELTEAVKIEIPGVATFRMSAADLDVEGAKTELQTKKKELADILEKYGVDTADALGQLQSDTSTEESGLKLKRKGYVDELARTLDGKEQSSLEAAYDETIGIPTREQADILSDIKTLTGDTVDIFIRVTEQSIESYKNEFVSEEENTAKIEGLDSDIIRYEADISSAEQIPDEYKTITDPEKMKTQLKQKVELAEDSKSTAYTQLSDARAAIKAAEEAEDYIPLDELKETVDDNEDLLSQRKDEYSAWKKIKETATRILNAAENNPLKTFEDDFRRYLAFLSDEGVKLDSLSEKLEANIYSGNNKMTYELLSEGTKDTVSLAFRLAVIKFLFPDGGGFVVFDDPFTDMDAERKARACSLLKEFAQNNQIIFVTCDKSYVDMLGGNFIDFANNVQFSS